MSPSRHVMAALIVASISTDASAQGPSYGTSSSRSRGKYVSASFGGYSRSFVLLPVSTSRSVTVIYSGPTTIVLPPRRVEFDDLAPEVQDLLSRRGQASAPNDGDLPAPRPARAARQLEPEVRAPEPVGPAKPSIPWPQALRPAEARELRQLARTAFAAGQIGRAAALFRQSLDTDADDAGANMGLIQSLLALSKYSTAAEAAQAATLRFPDWPTRTLRPLELYGDRGADYTADLARLEEALRRRPDDPVLLFLSAHALWFDGRREEALARFRRIDPAADGVNAAATARFLTIPPPAGV